MTNHTEALTDALREARAALLNPNLTQSECEQVVRVLEGALSITTRGDEVGVQEELRQMSRERDAARDRARSDRDAMYAAIDRHQLALVEPIALRALIAPLREALELTEEALSIHVIEERLRDQQAGKEHAPDDGDALALEKARAALRALP